MRATTLEDARQAIGYIAPDDRDVWIRIGMAIKSEFGEAGFDVWDQWGSIASSYKSADAKSAWKSFKQSGGVGIGSLFKEAMDNGFKFSESGNTVSPEQLAADQAARQAKNAKAEADRLDRNEAAANRAQSQWRTAQKEGESAYLRLKQVKAESCRYLKNDGGILIPMMRYDCDPARMVGKQSIADDGSKKYSGGMDKAGAACRLGAVPNNGELLVIVEGYATGLSVRMATELGYTVYVAFDTSGLLPVARILRDKYPESAILFAADDDYLTGNKGFEKAQAAALAVGNAAVVLPVFTVPRRLVKEDESLPDFTDFNDLHVAEGLPSATAQLLAAIASIQSGGVSPVPLAAASAPDQTIITVPKLESLLAHFALIYGKTDVWDGLNRQLMKKAGFVAAVGRELAAAWLAHPNRRTLDAASLPRLKRGRPADEGAGGDRQVEMLMRFTLLFGTTTVWDGERRKVMTLDSLRAAYGADGVKRWTEHQARMMIDGDNLVFDPTQQVSPDTHINMFEGLPLTPVENEALCYPILNLLYELCSAEKDSAQIAHWILRWLAYPLQHPGAKMQTAILMFGEKQGTGKSLFFEGIVRAIYGEYGTTAGQHQLDSQFTEWRSTKLYVLFEEVLARSDRYAHLGTIKHMITGRDMRINPKGLPERTESNHLNSVFLSNEVQPIPLELEDRRFMVVEALNKLSVELLAEIKASMATGGIEAFYHYLLNYDLDGFDPHSKPIMTNAKYKIISFGLSSWEVFYRLWKTGQLYAPYCSCLSEDLYQVYRRWCDKSSEKPLTMTKFSCLLSNRVTKERAEIQIGIHRKKLTVFKIVPDKETSESLSAQCERFRNVSEIKGGF